jgi:hypothetical protein
MLLVIWYALSPCTTAGRICSREAKNKSWQCDWSAKKFDAKTLDQFLLFYCSREQIRLVENGLTVTIRRVLQMLFENLAP